MLEIVAKGSLPALFGSLLESRGSLDTTCEEDDHQGRDRAGEAHFGDSLPSFMPCVLLRLLVGGLSEEHKVGLTMKT